jgi:hypothetical protein
MTWQEGGGKTFSPEEAAKIKSGLGRIISLFEAKEVKQASPERVAGAITEAVVVNKGEKKKGCGCLRKTGCGCGVLGVGVIGLVGWGVVEGLSGVVQAIDTTIKSWP